MSEKRKIKPGDMVYYAPSLAIGIILKELDDKWVYSLRSPKGSDRSHYLVSIRSNYKNQFEKAIDDGQFEYYRGGLK